MTSTRSLPEITQPKKKKPGLYCNAHVAPAISEALSDNIVELVIRSHLVSISKKSRPVYTD